MGGGGLNLLPKKSYCPWKPENIERVLRDEQKLLLEQEQQKQKEKGQRLDKIRRKGQQQQDDTTNNGHINLFQSEEEEFLKQKIMGNQPKQQSGIKPVSLGQSELKIRGDNAPFYLKKSTSAVESKELSSKEVKLKASMDPMKDYVRNHSNASNDSAEEETAIVVRSNDAKRERKREKRRKRLYSDDDDGDYKKRKKSKKKKRKKEEKKRRDQTSKDTDLAALRQKRLEREFAEVQRQQATLVSNNDQQDDRKRRYQNQFNPRLSRR